jgi:uncharacterized protein (TIRG00374 family)
VYEKTTVSSIGILKYFSPKRIAFPLIIGLGISAYFLLKDGDFQASVSAIDWTRQSTIWILTAVLLMFIRDFAYMLRLRILSSNQLTWRQSFEIIMLWEFASAVSPGAIGGTAAAVLIMAQEKLDSGLTTAIVLLTSFLDELFYIVTVPLIFLIISSSDLFPPFDQDLKLFGLLSTHNLQVVFWSGYAFLALWTLFLAFALFIRPNISKKIILFFVSLPLLKRYRKKGEKLGNDLVKASETFGKSSKRFWAQAFGTTVLTWTARFFVVNCLLLAFDHSFSSHFEVYGRHLIMWIILMIAPTPGGSGVAEFLFPTFLGKYLSSKIINWVAALWRIISYYPYIVLGAVVLPYWIKRVGLQKKLNLLKRIRNRSAKKAD